MGARLSHSSELPRIVVNEPTCGTPRGNWSRGSKGGGRGAMREKEMCFDNRNQGTFQEQSKEGPRKEGRQKGSHQSRI